MNNSIEELAGTGNDSTCWRPAFLYDKVQLYLFFLLCYWLIALLVCSISVFGRMKCHSPLCGIDRLAFLELTNGPYRLICGPANVLRDVSSEQ